MSKTLRENVLKMIDEVLLQTELSDAINNVIDSDELKQLIDCNYDKAMERINEMHKHVPENQKEQENEAFEAVISKETFTEKVKVIFKANYISTLLFRATDEVSFGKAIIRLKEDSSEEFTATLKDIIETLTSNMIGDYLESAYAGYLSETIPEDIPEEAKCFLQQLMGFGVFLPPEVLFSDIYDDDQNEE